MFQIVCTVDYSEITGVQKLDKGENLLGSNACLLVFTDPNLEPTTFCYLACWKKSDVRLMITSVRLDQLMWFLVGNWYLNKIWKKWIGHSFMQYHTRNWYMCCLPYPYLIGVIEKNVGLGIWGEKKSTDMTCWTCSKIDSQGYLPLSCDLGSLSQRFWEIQKVIWGWIDQ